uniref:Uncharacterized protein n=1 Tax=Caenorhabditis tropicalis TaxID=1561998 RepID=A0A1I7TXD0_9PELO
MNSEEIISSFQLWSRFRTRRIDVTEAFQDSSNVQLRNTFGIEMNIDIKRQSDTYFDQLKTSWSVSSGS